MQDPNAYIRGYNSQLKGTLELLSKYYHLIQWKKDTPEVVMDIGCGPGNVTWNVLRNMLPENCRTIYGVDVSEQMLEFGKKNYPAINFVNFDVSSAEFGTLFKNSIDHVFSFYCFHWIKDQGQLMKNLFDILKPGGDILTKFPGSHPVCDVYEKMSKMDKWNKYTKEIELGITAYQFHEDIESSLRELLSEAGFEILMCKCDNHTYIFPSIQELKNFLIGINPLQNYTKNIQEEFVDDIIQEFEEMNIVKKDEVLIHVVEKINLFYAQKPDKNKKC